MTCTNISGSLSTERDVCPLEMVVSENRDAQCGLPEHKIGWSTAEHLSRVSTHHLGTRLVCWREPCQLDLPRKPMRISAGEASGQWQTFRDQPLCWRHPVGDNRDKLRLLYRAVSAEADIIT